MDVGDWLTVAIGVVGAAAAFFGAWAGARAQRESSQEATAQQELQGRRDEWGRRFAAALDLLGQQLPGQRKLGHALLVQLLDSVLATEDDRRLGDAALEAVVDAVEVKYGPEIDDVELTVDDEHPDV